MGGAVVELVVVPWVPGTLIRIEWGGPTGNDLQRRSGLPIDPSDPDVRALIGAYEALLAAVPLDEATMVAAHTALLEVASLLRWAPHVGPAEREYVRRRTRAIGNHAALEVEQLAYLRAAIDGDQRQ